MITIIANREFDMDYFPCSESAVPSSGDVQRAQDAEHVEHVYRADNSESVQHASQVTLVNQFCDDKVSPMKCSVVLLTGVCEQDLDSAVLGLAAGKSGVTVLRYWVEGKPEDSGRLRVSRSPRLVQENILPEVIEGIDSNAHSKLPSDYDCIGDGRISLDMDDCCLTCTVKHDLGSLLRECAGSCSQVLVVLPPGMEATPIAVYLRELCSLDQSFNALLEGAQESADESAVNSADRLGEHGTGVGSSAAAEASDSCDLDAVSVGTIATVASEEGLRQSLFDDSPFTIDGESEDVGDDRSVGGAVMHLLHEAKHLLMVDSKQSGESAEADRNQGNFLDLLQILMPAGGVVHGNVSAVNCEDLIIDDDVMLHAEDSAQALPVAQEVSQVDNAESMHVDEVLPVTVGRESMSDEAIEFKAFGAHMFALSVRTSRLVHPGRLSDFLAADHQPMHIQAHFKVPTKPFSTFVWECEPNGSQIEQIPDSYLQGVQNNVTELFMVASCEDVNQDGSILARSIEDLLLNAVEMSQGIIAWMGQTDEFTKWAEEGPVGDEND
ncbi:hypothetical protein [Bifidobacterium sp.]|jgi:hypothetical protein|uniref:hypothetical protein n=1 Tax=Bifidobacterium sp. TaxID=41200 RepID=UPI0025C461A0|nr:hypothetical protein [Bifidobacterium sp.]MCI1635476.1 hypothetical protein [Bifidobacterium sp.]